MKIHLPGWDGMEAPSEAGLWLVEPTPRRDTRCWILDAGTACKVVYPVTRIQYLFAQSPICYAKLDDLLKNPKTRHSGKSAFGGLAGMTRMMSMRLFTKLSNLIKKMMSVYVDV